MGLPADAPRLQGGDLLGLAEKLDDLSALGVTALYLNPVFASAANHRYHTWDYHQVDPILGGNEALRELLDAAHARGMRVVLDGVFNHVGRGFFAFHSVLENGADSPYLDWFHLDVERLRDGRPLGAYAEPKLLRRSKRPKPAFEELGYSAWWDCPALPKLDTRTPAVREHLWDVAERWVRFGIDGWRLDVPSEIDDDEFWRELRRRVKRANPEAYLVGEIWHDARRWLAGDQFDATMNYPLAKAALGFFLPDLDTDALRSVGGYRDVVELDAAAFAAEVERVLGLYAPAVRDAQLNLIGSHDTPASSRSRAGSSPRFEMAFLFLFTMPGAPCIYYGDEIGLEGGPTPTAGGRTHGTRAPGTTSCASRSGASPPSAAPTPRSAAARIARSWPRTRSSPTSARRRAATRSSSPSTSPARSGASTFRSERSRRASSTRPRATTSS